MRPIAARLLLVLAAGSLLPACRGYDWRTAARRGETDLLDQPVLDRRRTFYDDDTSLLRSETSLKILRDRSTVKHGRETLWYRTGQKSHERFYRDGEPSGVWTRWYEDGTEQCRISYEDAGAVGEMIWWHPNGQTSSKGPARGGVREGYWTFWDEEGRVIKEGGYRGGRPQGPWIFRHPDGSISESGAFERGVRVGVWQRWEQGQRFEVDASDAPPGASRLGMPCPGLARVSPAARLGSSPATGGRSGGAAVADGGGA